MSEKKHIDYFDYIRVFAAISVIYMHVAADPLRDVINWNWHAMNVLVCLGFTAVPLFFMMSGGLLLSNEKTLDVSVLLKKRLPRLIVPLIFWTIVALLWQAYLDQSFAGFFSGLLSSLNKPAWVHFWYMYTLIALYVISPVLYGGLQALDRKGHIFVFALALLPTARTILLLLLPPSLEPLVNIDIINKLTFFGGHLSSFVLGYYLMNTKRRIPNALLLLCAATLLGIIIVGTYALTVRSGSFQQAFQNQSSGFEILLAACLFLLAKQNLNRKSAVLQRIPVIPLSLSIYLMHGILLSWMDRTFEIVSFADTLFYTFLNFILCFAVTKTLASIKPLCFPVTGLSYRDACKSCNWVFTWCAVRGRKKSSNENVRLD